MLDIKEVITILCNYLKETVNSTLTAEHFRLAKYNQQCDDIIDAFWNTLDKVTYYALKEQNNDMSFNDFDKLDCKYIRTKLRLACLQYPSLQIYSLGGTSISSTRALLIALAWLIAKYDIFKNIVQSKLINSSLGREFSKFNTDCDKKVDDENLLTVPNQINNLLVKANKLNSNLKAIYELNMEKVKFTTRVHTASMNMCGLPHLSVSEMSLVKKLTINKTSITEDELNKIKEMEQTANLLDTHLKWTKSNHIFFTWMSTVCDKSDKIEESLFNEEATMELNKFIYLLRHLVKKRLRSIFKNDNHNTTTNSIQDCPARLLRVQKSITEAHLCLTEKIYEFNAISDDLRKKRLDLDIELKSILNLIPNCIQI